MADCRISESTRARIAAAWETILAALAAGLLVRDVLENHGISTGEMRAYRASVPGAQAEYDAARESSADAFLDEALHVARNRTPDAAHARTRIDTLKWAARIRNPRAYADRQQVDMTVRSIDLTRILAEANARLIAARAARLIGSGTLEASPAAAGAVRAAIVTDARDSRDGGAPGGGPQELPANASRGHVESPAIAEFL